MIHLRATASTAEALIERAPNPDHQVGRPPGGNDLRLRVPPGGAGSMVGCRVVSVPCSDALELSMAVIDAGPPRLTA
jgi:hypothetical protein